MLCFNICLPRLDFISFCSWCVSLFAFNLLPSTQRSYISHLLTVLALLKSHDITEVSFPHLLICSVSPSSLGLCFPSCNVLSEAALWPLNPSCLLHEGTCSALGAGVELSQGLPEKRGHAESSGTFMGFCVLKLLLLSRGLPWENHIHKC